MKKFSFLILIFLIFFSVFLFVKNVFTQSCTEGGTCLNEGEMCCTDKILYQCQSKEPFDVLVSATYASGEFSVTWEANVSGGTPPYNYVWTGSDNLSGTTQLVEKNYYGDEGEKEATCVVTDAYGLSVTDYSIVTIQYPDKFVAGFLDKKFTYIMSFGPPVLYCCSITGQPNDGYGHNCNANLAGTCEYQRTKSFGTPLGTQSYDIYLLKCPTGFDLQPSITKPCVGDRCFSSCWNPSALLMHSYYCFYDCVRR